MKGLFGWGALPVLSQDSCFSTSEKKKSFFWLDFFFFGNALKLPTSASILSHCNKSSTEGSFRFHHQLNRFHHSLHTTQRHREWSHTCSHCFVSSKHFVISAGNFGEISKENLSALEGT